MAIANDHHEIPHLLVFPPLIDEEIGLDQLIHEDEFNPPENIEIVQPLMQEQVNEDQIMMQHLEPKVQKDQNVAYQLGVPQWPLLVPINEEQVMMQQFGPQLQEEQNEIQQLIPKELQQPLPPLVHEQQPRIHNLQVGMALIPEFQFGAVFAGWEARKKLVETTRILESLVQQGNSGNLIVKVPSNWFQFFTTVLLSPDNFGWAKEFLASGAPSFLVDSLGNMSIPIPEKCPTLTSLPCGSWPSNSSLSDLVDESNGKEQSAMDLDATDQLDLNLSLTSGNVKKKRNLKRATLVVDTEV